MKTLDKMRGEDLFFFLQNFGGYLMKVPASRTERAIDQTRENSPQPRNLFCALGCLPGLNFSLRFARNESFESRYKSKRKRSEADGNL